MPSNRTKRTRRRVLHNELSEDQEYYLLTGVCLDGFSPDFGHPRISPMWHVPFESEEAIRQAWEQNREQIMDLAGEPFQRPWAFWQFEATDRLTLAKWHGCDAKGWGYFNTPEGLSYPEPREVEESERDYLARHPDLLTAAERELLTK